MIRFMHLFEIKMGQAGGDNSGRLVDFMQCKEGFISISLTSIDFQLVFRISDILWMQQRYIPDKTKIYSGHNYYDKQGLR